MTRYHFKRKPVPVGGDVEIPDDAIGVNITHEVPPNRSPAENFIEWLEPADD